MLLGNIKRALKERVSRPAKRQAKQVLLKLLTRLDGSIATNLAASNATSLAFARGGLADSEIDELGQPSSEASSGVSHSAEVRNSTSTLVMNDGGTIVHSDMLATYFRAIFAASPDTPALRLAWDFLSQDSSRWTDYATLVSSLREHFSRQKSQGGDPEEYAALAQHLSRHETDTQNNQSAYGTRGKWNPSAVYWPDPTAADNPRSLHGETPIARESPLIDKQTPLGSAGSCFAMEIAHRLQADGFNYVVTEPEPNDAGHSPSCAQWGIIFNTPSFRQLAEKAFGVRRLPRILWSQKIGGDTQFRDPFREDVIFRSVDEYDRSYEPHLQATREALLRAKVFVLTLGMNEVWRLKGDDVYFSRSPWRIAAGIVERRVLSVADNVRELQRMLDLWREHNPEIQLIVSVSPVPLHATFRGDEHHVVAANAHSKATLRLAAEEFCGQNRGVHYFPSYELVMYCTENAWQPDQRHVSRHAVDKVMNLFGRMFLKSPEARMGGNELEPR